MRMVTQLLELSKINEGGGHGKKCLLEEEFLDPANHVPSDNMRARTAYCHLCYLPCQYCATCCPK